MKFTWRVWIALAGVLTAIYFIAPNTSETKLVLYNGTGLLAVISILIGIKRNDIRPRAPWYLFAAGLGSFLVADICYYVLELVSGENGPPFPSIADFFYLMMYPLVVIGLTLLLRTTAPGRNGTTFIDAFAVGIAVLGVLWVLFVDDVVAAGSNMPALVTQLAYPVGDVALLAVAARLVIKVHLSYKPFAFITAAIASLVIADVNYGILNTKGEFTTGMYVDLFWLGFYVMFGAAALHPDAAREPHTVENAEGRLTPRQITIMFVATLAVPLVDLFWGVPMDRPVTITASALLSLLILVRVYALTRELEHGRDRLHHEATHDALTGLCNRTLFAEETAAAIRLADHEALAVLFIDLDDFKTVNDSMGHEAGDELLREAARRLETCARPGDVVARLGGDEFAVLLRSAKDRNDVVSVARRILDALDEPIDLSTRAVRIGCSIGIAVDLDDDLAVETLLRNADVAMYLSKARGKGRYEFFEASMHEEAVERLDLKADLERAVTENEFFLHYQPIFDLQTGRVVHAEALVRWRHPDRGVIAPDRFIPLAEENGQIVPIGSWVLREACMQASRWRRIPGCEEVGISINLSMRQLQDDQLFRVVTAALKDSGLPASLVTLEITESMLAVDAEHTQAILEQLKTIGVKLAIDDFGTGYSSLSYLRAFPVDSIKIDKSFIKELHNSTTTAALIEAMVNLSTALGATTVAEGIEYSEQATILRRLGCSKGQGFYYCRPLSGAALTSLLREHTSDDIEPLEAWRRASEHAQQRVFETEIRLGLSEIAAVSTEMDDLCRQLKVPVMGRWAWQRNWAESFHSWKPVFIGVRAADSGALKAFALLASIERAEGTSLVAVGHGSSICSILPAHDEAASEALATAVARYLADLPGTWSLDLEQLPELDRTAHALVDRLENAQLLPELRVPRVMFSAEHRLETILSKSMRKQLRRAHKKITDAGLDMTIAFDRGRAITSELIDEVEMVHVSRDRVSRRQSDLDRPAEREFWRRVAEGSLDNLWEVEIASLRFDGELAAYVVALLDGDVYRVYDGRMNTEWQDYSPGRLVEAAALQRALLDPRFHLLDWMSGVAAEKLLAANVAEARTRLVATSGSRPLMRQRNRELVGQV